MTPKKCAICGKEISATAEKCPHCGHMTRYGKTQEDSKKPQPLHYIGALAFAVGLFLLIPAVVELRDLGSYANIYAAIHPTESKMLGVKCIVGILLVAGGSGPVIKLLKKK